MKQKHFMILLSIVALVVSSFMIAGNVGAMYQSDGSVQNGTTGGWTAPDDGICVLGLHADGTMDVDTTIKTARDCQARLVTVTAVTPNDTLANVCGNSSKNTAGVKYAAPGSSTCVTTSGGYISGSYSLVNLDRNATMCQGLGGLLASTTGTVKNTANGTAATCIAYGWQYRGMDANVNDATYGQPNAFGSIQSPLSNGGKSGTDNTLTPNVGLCYASMRTTLAVASCPTVIGSTTGTANSSASAAFGYSVSGTYCVYAYGINGPLNAAINNTTGVSGSAGAIGATVNLGQYTTLGTCLANGGSWSNWIPDGTAATIGVLNGITSAVTFDLTREAVNSDNGCLHCHSTLSQQNGDVYRQKDSYLMTGHKNMLRKVIPGMVWAGPSGIYTTDGTNALNWGTFGVLGSATDGTNPMYYIYGDWMATYPTVAIAGSNYACANCHSTGFSGGTAATPGVESIGTPGYVGRQPGDSGANYVSAVKAGYTWDLEGINCSRCHAATVAAVTQTMISGGTCKNGTTDVTSLYPTQIACSAATYTWTAIGTPSAFPTTLATSGGMGNLPSGTGRNALCFGCHQSIAKNWPAQGGSATGTAQYDPTLIPTGVSHGAASGRDFNGHVLGNSFLNSVHARYAGAQSGNGSITANSLGENDLTDPNGTTEYNSIFKGYTCYQGAGSSDVALTDALGNPLNTMTSCNAIYGTGSWKVDTNGSQGTCTTCHDVHNSLFVASQASKAIKKECMDCHVNNATTGATDASVPTVSLASTNHPTVAGTPFDTTKYGSDSCSVCHMATQAVANGNQNSMPAHVWRISTDPNYNTFPTSDQFNGTNGATLDRNAQTAFEIDYDGSVLYKKAVWVDIDMACGQCHGGSLGSGSTSNGAPYFTKSALAARASGMHSGSIASASFIATNDPTTSNLVNFDASSSSCPSGDTCVYRWSFGDSAKTTTVTQTPSASFAYAQPGSYNVSLMLIGTPSGSTNADSHATYAAQVTAATVYVAPVASFTTSASGFTVTVKDTTTSGSKSSTTTGTVTWGDNTTTNNVALGASVAHAYNASGTYMIGYSVTDGVTTSTATSQRVTLTPVYVTVSGAVYKADGKTPVSGATVNLYTISGSLVKRATTAANGSYSLTSVASGNYTLKATYSNWTFGPVNISVAGTNVTTGTNITSTSN